DLADVVEQRRLTDRLDPLIRQFEAPRELHGARGNTLAVPDRPAALRVDLARDSLERRYQAALARRFRALLRRASVVVARAGGDRQWAVPARVAPGARLVGF